VLGLVLFGSAFGYLEAAVVSYLRYLHEPVLHFYSPALTHFFNPTTARPAVARNPVQVRTWRKGSTTHPGVIPP
jgi:hypothetical protein